MKKVLSVLLALLVLLGMFSVLTACQETEKETVPESESVFESGSESTSETDCTHAYVETDRVEPTCTDAGSVTRTCPDCGDVQVETIPALGHDYKDEVKAPTCTEDGSAVHTCSRCNDTYTDTLTATGHVLSGNQHLNESGVTVITCSHCGVDVAVTDEESARLAAIAASILGTRQRIVAYGVPRMDNPLLFDHFHLMMEAGINTAVTGGLESSGGVWVYVDAANDSGVDLLLDASAVFKDAASVTNKLLFLDEEEHVAGVYLRDEPYPFWFGALGALAASVRQTYTDANWLVAANLLGWGNPAYAWNGVHEDGTQEYTTFGQIVDGSLTFKEGMTPAAMRNAMELYGETVDPDYICFDVYPFSGKKGGDLPLYLANLAFFQTYALKYEIPMWTFLQTSHSDVSGAHDPSYEQIRCETNLSLAAGAETLLCFTVCETTEWSYMISTDGEIRPIYHDAKKVFTGIHEMKGVYLDYTFDKYILATPDARFEQLIGEYEVTEMLADTYVQLESVVTEGSVFVGCGKNAEGNTGLYVVNMNFKQNGATTDVTLNLNDACAYRLWSDTNGLEAEGTTDTFCLILEPGEGCFIELN